MSRESDDVLPTYDESLEQPAPPAAESTLDEKRRRLSEAAQFENPFKSASDEAGPSSPPGYKRYDPAANAFILGAPLVFSTTGAARYQLQQILTKSGKPYQLRIRTLVPSESRRLSTISQKSTNSVDYDDDLSLYSIQKIIGLGSQVELQGLRQSRTLPGLIRFDTGGLTRSCKVWHLTRNEARDSLKEENQKRMQKYGYRADEEWNRVLLFSVEGTGLLSRTYVWKDGNGNLLATEADGRLDFANEREISQKRKDALVACWVGKGWASSSLPWDE